MIRSPNALILVLMQAASLLALEGMVVMTNLPPYRLGSLSVKYLSTGKTRTLATSGVWGPCISPDGTKVAYAYNDQKIRIVGIDGAGTRDVTTIGGKETYVTWTKGDYVWWCQCDRSIYRVKSDGTDRKVMYTDPDAASEVHGLSLSADGNRAAWTRPSWLCTGYEFSTKKYTDFGWGCQSTPSPDGAYITHNAGGHNVATIDVWDTKAEYKRFYPAVAGAQFNNHRWSHHSMDYLTYFLQGANTAYLYNVQSGVALLLGSGVAFDFFPVEVGRDSAQSGFSLSKDAVLFTAVAGQAAQPAEATLTVTNSAASALGQLSVSGAPAWLSVTVAGSGNGQTIRNAADPARSAGPGTYEATVTVTPAGSLARASYVVTLQYLAAQASPVVVTAPKAGQSFKVGESLPIAWYADCSQVPGVEVELSTNNGDSWTSIEASGNLKCGVQTWAWTITDSLFDAASGHKQSTLSTACKLRVANYFGAGEGESEGAFTIMARNAAARPYTAGRRPGLSFFSTGRGIRLVNGQSGNLPVEAVMLDGRIRSRALLGPADSYHAGASGSGVCVLLLGGSVATRSPTAAALTR